MGDDIGLQQIGMHFELDAFGIQKVGTRGSALVNMVEAGGRA